MRFRLLLALAALTFGLANAPAAFLINIGSVTVAAGSATTVDVTISGGPEFLDTFGVEFLITSSGSPAGILQFVDPQWNSQLDDSNYVFAGDSTGGGGAVTTTTTTNDTYIGGDGTLEGTGVGVGGVGMLLVRLDVSALAASPGDLFTISLVNSVNTFFYDPDFDPMTFTSTTGTITVTEAGPLTAATPAPAGLLVGLAGAGGLWLARRTRRTPKAG